MKSSTMPASTPIPVFVSRFTPGITERPGYGAFIPWCKGDRAIARPTIVGADRSPLTVTVRSDELKWHDQAPEIDSARGRGRWVIECLCDDTGELAALSAAILELPQSDTR